MIKWFKKHCKKLIIASSILTACICCLFGFTKSYAYDYQDNKLVGNNLIDNCDVNYCFVSGDSFNLNNPMIPSENLNISHNVNDNFIDIEFTNNTVVNGVSYLCIYLPMNQLYAVHNANTYYNIGLLVESENFTKTTYYLSGMNTFLMSTNSYGNSFNFISSTPTFNLNYLVGSNSMIFNYAISNTNFYNASDSNLCFLINIRNNIQQSDFNLGHLKFKAYIFEGHYNINYAYSNTSVFVPYSSIEELQEVYITLQQQYNSYVASHSYTNTQYNDLVSANSSLQQQISNLQLQYDVYVASHSHTNEEYNELYERLGNLQENYSDLHDELLELQSDYEDLQNQYNELLNKYQRYQNPASYGWFTYIDYIQAYNSSYDSGEIDFDTLVSQGYISNYTFLLDDFVNHYIEADDGTLHVDIVFRENVVPLNLFEFTFTDMIYSGFLSIKNFYMNTNGSSFTYSFNHNVINVKEFYYMEHGVYPNDEQLELAKAISQYIYVNQITLDNVPLRSDVHDFTIVSNDAVDSYSFNLGFQSGYYNGTLTNNDLKTEINGLNKKINELYTNINTLRNLNSELQDQISNSYGWKSLFFAMADTPFKTVSNVLGFELFGLNLFTTFIGIITVFAIIWILKKFI